MIECKAIAENSLFVTAKGDILPCCWLYRNGPALNEELRQIISEENYNGLVKSWSSDKPFHTCVETCDNHSTSTLSIRTFDAQGKNKNDGIL